ncbi:MAG: peptide deformylase [Candidatus Pacebacteria bacterium]|nr:peptide deformylase [Candidatus Paceibacterota bacterium]
MPKTPRDIDIVQSGEPVLRKVATPVALEEIESLRIQRIIEKMKAALDSQDDGVAIAAPQIGESVRIFVVSGKVFSGFFEHSEDASKKPKPLKDEVYINPEIIKISKDRKTVEEGCLSVRWLYGKTKRASRATIRAYNERGPTGLLAQIFQHETDHLNGILFIDHAKDIHELPPEDPSAKK